MTDYICRAEWGRMAYLALSLHEVGWRDGRLKRIGQALYCASLCLSRIDSVASASASGATSTSCVLGSNPTLPSSAGLSNPASAPCAP